MTECADPIGLVNDVRSKSAVLLEDRAAHGACHVASAFYPPCPHLLSVRLACGVMLVGVQSYRRRRAQPDLKEIRRKQAGSCAATKTGGGTLQQAERGDAACRVSDLAVGDLAVQ